MPFEVKICHERLVIIFTLEGCTYFLEYPGVFFFCFIFINIGIMSHEIANLGNSISQILHFI